MIGKGIFGLRGGGCIVVAMLAACGGGGGGGSGDGSVQGSGGSANLNQPANTAPTIFGTPATDVTAGSSYAFTPAADDPDFDALTYTIVNKPQWARFDNTNGTLSGAPDNIALGTTYGVVISVSDGLASDSLPAFDLTVSPNSSGGSGGLPISDTQPDRYEWTLMEDGQKAYVDLDFVFGDIPGSYEGFDFLRTANDDKFVSSANAVSFTVGLPVTVYVGYDSRIPMLPAWLNGWTNTGDHWGGAQIQTDVYRRDFPAGPVVLGGNEMGLRMYTVAIGPQGLVNPPPPQQPRQPGKNTPPTIGGSPATSIIAGNGYQFRPTASDADGDPLAFTINNKPSWANFNATTGRLSGTPGTSAIGVHANIVIVVNDGKSGAALPLFNIAVQQPGTPPPPPPPPPPAPPTVNKAPTIGGSPATSVTAGNGYQFTPTAFDADGDPLAFTISNKPSWANFNATTGRLSGTPGTSDIGVHGNIIIVVNDGQSGAALPPFSINVGGLITGSATLSWNAPTQNSDGSPLTDLAGYRAYYSKTLGNYGPFVPINNAGITTYVIDGLSQGTWYFVMTALDTSGNESEVSNAASKTIVSP